MSTYRKPGRTIGYNRVLGPTMKQDQAFFELFYIFTTGFSDSQVAGSAVRDWILSVIGVIEGTQDETVMKRLIFEKRRRPKGVYM